MAVEQVKDLGLGWVLIGHSERRGEFGLPTPAESNSLMSTKLAYILDQGLNCVFCIGEPLTIREKGIHRTLFLCTVRTSIAKRSIVNIITSWATHKIFQTIWNTGIWSNKNFGDLQELPNLSFAI